MSSNFAQMAMAMGQQQQASMNAQLAGLCNQLGNIGSAIPGGLIGAGGGGAGTSSGVVIETYRDFETDSIRQRVVPKQGIRDPNLERKFESPKQKETTMKDDGLLPDISLARVFKWAIVLLIAMGLGQKVWSTFGAKIEKQLHKALGTEVTP